MGVPADAAAHQLPVRMLLPAGLHLIIASHTGIHLQELQQVHSIVPQQVGQDCFAKHHLRLLHLTAGNYASCQPGTSRGMLHHWQHQHKSLQLPSNKHKSRKQGDKSQ